MAISLNHTIVVARDKEKSAAFLTDIFGLAPHRRLGHFAVVQAGDTSLDFVETDGNIEQRHFAFLVSEAEFDAIFERIAQRRLHYWADPILAASGARLIHMTMAGVCTLTTRTATFWKSLRAPYGSGGPNAANPNPLLPRS